LKRYVADRAFPATLSPLCGWCPLVNACPVAARDGKVARVDGLLTAAELGIPTLGAIAAVAIGPNDPVGERPVTPGSDAAVSRACAVEAPDDEFAAPVEPPAAVEDAWRPFVDAELAAAHMDPQEPGRTGTQDGGAVMTSLLREDKPWEQTAGPDGLLNPNSYSATAVFGIVEMAVELLYAAGVQLGSSVVTALSRTLAHVVLAMQRDLAGSTSYQDGVNTRLRGALRTAVATMPPPFGRDAQAWSAWVARVTRRTDSIAKAAVALFDDDPGAEPPYRELVDLARPAPRIPEPGERLKAVS
jgi:putative RecB family exonuclease